MKSSNHQTTAAITHLSIFSQYFLPFGNFIFPIVIWSTCKNKSPFIDHHGRQTINFQLSVLLYSIALALIAIPVLLFSIFKNVPFNAILDDDNIFAHFTAGNFTGIVTIAIVAILLIFTMKVLEFFLVINAAVKAANGEQYRYPLTIPFIAPVALENYDHEPAIVS